MSPLWLLLIPIAAGGWLGYRRLSRALSAPAARGPETREMTLSRRLAAMLQCNPKDVLPAVTNEIGITPNATDDVILKRAKYHYQQNAPDKQCYVWQDRKAG